MGGNNLGFRSLTVFILANNETDLLRKTVEEIRKNCKDDDLEKIVVYAKTYDCPGYLETLKMIEEKFEKKLKVQVQRLKNGFDCFVDLPNSVSSSHFIVIAADMEMDPGNIGEFIERAREYPERIVCASKWMKGSRVEGYGFFHALGSRLMNNFVAWLYNVKAKDIFSLYQIYPTSVFQRMRFNNPSAFMYEYTLKPLRLGVEYEEIPTVYKKRTEGTSRFNIPFVMFRMAFKFCAAALRIRFTPKRCLLNEKTHR